MTNKIINKDERTTFIENKSFKYGYNILTFGIFADMIYRERWLHQSTDDLFLLVVLTAVIVTLYQYKQKIFSINWIRKNSLALIIIFIFAFLLALVIKKHL
jgi:hypothetical protein